MYTHDHTIGIKVFCLVLSTGFLYNWHVYRASEDPLKGADYMYRLIYSTLLGDPIWDFINIILFCDAAFTTIRLFRDLYDRRGIFAVGPINVGKPDNGGGPNSWPIQNFKKTDTRYLPRGWDRLAFSKTERNGWLQALTWRDNKFVKMLSTVFITNSQNTVLRFASTHSHTHTYHTTLHTNTHTLT